MNCTYPLPTTVLLESQTKLKVTCESYYACLFQKIFSTICKSNSTGSCVFGITSTSNVIEIVQTNTVSIVLLVLVIPIIVGTCAIIR